MTVILWVMMVYVGVYKLYKQLTYNISEGHCTDNHN